MYLNAKNPVSSEEICQARLTTARDSEFGIQDSGFGTRGLDRVRVRVSCSRIAQFFSLSFVEPLI